MERAPRADAPAAAPARDARLRDDCGGWEPSTALIDAALAPDLLPAEGALRVDALRAGLRLRDDAAARRCAARLEWTWIDRWECARCVDLLVDHVMRPGTEADFEEFRSYIGSVELGRYFGALPKAPPPDEWAVDPVAAIGQMHRVAKAEHIPDYLALADRIPGVADTAWSDVSLLGMWNDAFREEIQRGWLRRSGVAPPVGEPQAVGLSPSLAACLRRDFLDPAPQRDPPLDPPPDPSVDPSTPPPPARPQGTMSDWDRRWLWESSPSPADTSLLAELSGVGDPHEGTVSGAALMLLGRMGDAASEAALRERVDIRAESIGDDVARMALARRGDGEYADVVEEAARGGDAILLALLMEAYPKRARTLIEDAVVRGTDTDAANVLDALAKFVPPGAWHDWYRLDWRRTSFEGFERLALEARLPAPRLARIGTTIPGCRTRAVALAAARALRAGDLREEDVANSFGEDEAAFLETGAGEELAAALRAFAAAGGQDADAARSWLELLGDPACGRVDLGLVRTPEVRAHLTAEVRKLRGPEPAEGFRSAAMELAVAHGLPEGAAWAFTSADALPDAACDLLLAGDAHGAFLSLLDANPDTPLGDVGEVDHPRVREWLASLRARRHLGHYWYATAQLAAMGDPAARAEWWGAMQDGRYRIVDGGSAFERTLGWRLAETIPFWISELKSQCCRIVTGSEGDIIEDVLGIDDGYTSPFRTYHDRAKELWDSAGGDFVRSRIAGHFVPRPR
ncbi:MAG: hypothetical protein HMLKMBBP_00487 [Planctomycetes bacterium]|nr:hypothetical protein [Planctomycetota bacterium]